VSIKKTLVHCIMLSWLRRLSGPVLWRNLSAQIQRYKYLYIYIFIYFLYIFNIILVYLVSIIFNPANRPIDFLKFLFEFFLLIWLGVVRSRLGQGCGLAVRVRVGVGLVT
jgi:hypothetical protein